MDVQYLKHLVSLVVKEKAVAENQSKNMLSGSIYDLEKRGVALTNMTITAETTLVPETMLIKFGKRNHKSNIGITLRSLPGHKLAKGDMVDFKDINDAIKRSSRGNDDDVGMDRHATGIVYNVFSDVVEVAVSTASLGIVCGFSGGGVCNIVKKGNNVVYSRMLAALQTLLRLSGNNNHSLLTKTLLEMKAPTAPILLDTDETTFFNTSLNENQKDAVHFSVHSPELSLIHGPPGTGKTHTLVEIISQLTINHNKKVLVCGPSHVSVDNLLLRAADRKDIKVVRLGSPARVSPESLKHTLDVKCFVGNSKNLESRAENEINKLNYLLKTKLHIDEKKETAQAMKKLNMIFRTTANTRKKSVEVLKEADAVFCTLAEAGGRTLKNQTFDVVIIDEAGQATEPECWVALVKANKCILAGDHLQLPPTVLSQEKTINGEVIHAKGMSKMNGLSYTLFDRLLDTHGKNFKKMLVIQYRMHKKIMEFSSNELYESKLVAHKSVENHALHDLKVVIKHKDTATPIAVIDTSDSGGCYETSSKSSLDSRKSIGNDFEAKLVVAHLKKLLDQGLSQLEIGVITPYAAQVKKINMLIASKWPHIEVKTVDGFQGREKEAVVLSLVRSNGNGNVGFLSNKRRLNVAMTRAKRHLAIVCDMNTMTRPDKSSQKDFLIKWAKWLELEAVVKGSR